MARPNLFAFGNCTYYAFDQATWLPESLRGDAYMWWTNYTGPKSATPVAGSVVVYAPGGLYDAATGHVAIVQSVNGDGSFVVREMNFRGFNQVDTRTSTMEGVLGFLLPPGSSAGTAPGASAAPVLSNNGPGLGDVLTGGIGAFIPGVSNVIGGIAGEPGQLVAGMAGVLGQFAADLIGGAVKGVVHLSLVVGEDMGAALHRSAIAFAVAAVVVLVLMA